MPIFPDVPFALGVPPVLRSAIALVAAPFTFLTRDAFGLGQIFGGSLWGIFDDSGAAVAVADNVIAVDFRKEWKVSDYPVESGGFAAYDKVETPFGAKVTFSVGGSAFNRTLFLTQLQQAAASLDLYTVVTPEVTYPSANVERYDYRRETSNGATLMSVDVWVTEIRVTASQGFTNTQLPGGADTQHDGTVQTADPTPVQSSAFQSAVPVPVAQSSLNDLPAVPL